MNKPGHYFPIIKLMHLGVLSSPQKAYMWAGNKTFTKTFFFFLSFFKCWNFETISLETFQEYYFISIFLFLRAHASRDYFFIKIDFSFNFYTFFKGYTPFTVITKY